MKHLWVSLALVPFAISCKTSEKSGSSLAGSSAVAAVGPCKEAAKRPKGDKERLLNLREIMSAKALQGAGAATFLASVRNPVEPDPLAAGQELGIPFDEATADFKGNTEAAVEKAEQAFVDYAKQNPGEFKEASGQIEAAAAKRASGVTGGDAAGRESAALNSYQKAGAHRLMAYAYQGVGNFDAAIAHANEALFFVAEGGAVDPDAERFKEQFDKSNTVANQVTTTAKKGGFNTANLEATTATVLGQVAAYRQASGDAEGAGTVYNAIVKGYNAETAAEVTTRAASVGIAEDAARSFDGKSSEFGNSLRNLASGGSGTLQLKANDVKNAAKLVDTKLPALTQNTDMAQRQTTAEALIRDASKLTQERVRGASEAGARRAIERVKVR